jgi:hypothetical protein
VPHPDAPQDLWNGCVLTRLAGTVTPEAMLRDDLRIRFESAKPRRGRYYSSQGARQTGTVLGLLIWIAGIPVGLLGFHRRLRSKGGRLFVGLRVIPVLVTAVLIAGAVTAVSLPVINVEIQERQAARHNIDLMRILWATGNYVSDHTGTRKTLTAEEAEAECQVFFAGKAGDARFYMKQGILNYREGPVVCPLTGKPMREGDSPGDYEIIEDERGVVLRIYGPAGNPLEMILTCSTAE